MNENSFTITKGKKCIMGGYFASSERIVKQLDCRQELVIIFLPAIFFFKVWDIGKS